MSDQNKRIYFKLMSEMGTTQEIGRKAVKRRRNTQNEIIIVSFKRINIKTKLYIKKILPLYIFFKEYL